MKSAPRKHAIAALKRVAHLVRVVSVFLKAVNKAVSPGFVLTDKSPSQAEQRVTTSVCNVVRRFVIHLAKRVTNYLQKKVSPKDAILPA